MWLLLVEALLAMLVLVFIVWWTMFSGRQPEVRPGDEHNAAPGDETSSRE